MKLSKNQNLLLVFTTVGALIYYKHLETKNLSWGQWFVPAEKPLNKFFI